MNRKHRRHKCTAPKRTGWRGRSPNTAAGAKTRHPPQNQEKQDRRRRVEQDIGQMMAAGAQSVKLAVQHMGNPGQRMPVGGMDVGERPDDPLERQSPGDFRVIIHVIVVVVIDKVVPQRLPENGKRDRRQKKADAGDRPAVIQTRRGLDYGRELCTGHGMAAAFPARLSS